MASTVLVVDVGSGIRDIVERNIDAASWTLIQREDVDAAWNDASAKPPDLVVLNADVAKGWNLCAQLKRRFPVVPVVLLSYKANKELFNNHQKLPTRADAYHHLPDELDGLGISLSYYSSHKAEVEEEEVAPAKRQRSASRVSVPTGVVQRLEQTVRDQARDLEGLKRQIEALEAERDAVSEKARRQMMELMAVAPGPDLSGEVTSHKRRVAELESDLETVRAAARDAADRAQMAQDALRNATAAAESAQSEMIALRSQTRAAGNTAEQLTTLTAQLAQVEQRRIAADAARAAAEERATTAERAWSSINTRAEELNQALLQRNQDVERIAKEKSDVETTLAMSRKLMKDYISEAARNAEAARVANERVKELEARASEVAASSSTAHGELEFQKSLVESLEESQRVAVEKVKALERQIAGLETDLGAAREKSASHASRSRALEIDNEDKTATAQAATARVAGLEAEIVALKQAAEAELLALRQAAEHDIAAAGKKAEAEIAAAKAAAETELTEFMNAAEGEREASKKAYAELRESFDELRAWARKLESRLVSSEHTRDVVQARLGALLDDLKSLPSGGIEPPPVSLDP